MKKCVDWNLVIYLGEKKTVGEIFFVKKNKRAYTFTRHLRTKMTLVVEYFDVFFEMEE
jgi:hypothetical protein